jgi:hypothetical protein
MTWRYRDPFVALCRLDNSASACAARKSIVWDVGYKPTTATSTATSTATLCRERLLEIRANRKEPHYFLLADDSGAKLVGAAAITD